MNTYIMEESGMLIQTVLLVSLAFAIFGRAYGRIRNKEKDYEKIRLSYSILIFFFGAGIVITFLVPVIHLILHASQNLIGLTGLFCFPFFDFFEPSEIWLLLILIALWLIGVTYKVVRDIRLVRENGYKRIAPYGNIVLGGPIYERFEMLYAMSELKEMPYLQINQAVTSPKAAYSVELKSYVIILPDKKLSLNEFDAAVYHEMVHLKKHDLLVRGMFNLFFELYWFLTLKDKWKQEVKELQETICDQEVTKALRQLSKTEYYEQIINLAVINEDHELASPGRVLDLEERMKRMKKDLNSKKHMASVSLPVAICTILAILIYAGIWVIPRFRGVSSSYSMEDINLSEEALKSFESLSADGANILLEEGVKEQISLAKGEIFISQPLSLEADDTLAITCYTKGKNYRVGVMRDDVVVFEKSAVGDYMGICDLENEGVYQIYLVNDSSQATDIEMFYLR